MHQGNLEELLQKASALREQGRFDEAQSAYAQVVTQAPGLGVAWFNLGFCQRNCGRYEDALASYQRAIDCGIDRPEEVHLNRAVILTDLLRRDEEAERELQRALALNPNYEPALLNLGNLSEDLGRRLGAAKAYARLLALNPGNFEGLARYAGVASVNDKNDPLIARLEAAISDQRASAAERASLGFALGSILDALGAYDAAFSAYVEANRNSATSRPDARYDRLAHERLVDALIGAFPLKPQRVSSAETRSPTTFICGMFRSGSTLVERVLEGHPRVSAGGELPFLPALVQRALQPFPESVQKRSAEDFAQIASAYAQSVAGVFPNADIVTDKRPDNFLLIGLIKTLYPDAKFVHSVREALDNCLSIFFLHLDQSLAYALDLEDIGHYYRQYQRLMAHWKQCYRDDIFDFDYDAFVEAPEATLRGLLKFLNLEWDESLLRLDQRSSAVKTASVWQVREGVYQRSSGRWRNYASQLGPLRAALGLPNEP